MSNNMSNDNTLLRTLVKSIIAEEIDNFPPHISLNEKLDAEDMDQLYQSIKNNVDQKLASQILNIIKDHPADNQYDDEDIEDIYNKITKIASTEDAKKILGLIHKALN